MNRYGLVFYVLALVGCGGNAPTASGTAPPTPSASAAPSPSLTASATPPPPDVPRGAPPLSERAAQALSLDLLDRTNLAFWGNYPGPPHATIDGTIIVISGDPSAPLDEAAKVTRETVDALWSGPYFTFRPENAVVAWVTSSPARLHALVRENAPALRDSGRDLGMYEPQSRQIFAAIGPAGWGSYNHELVHPLLRADFPRAPSWIDEGLPALFEVSEIRPDGTFGFGAHFRLETLRTALTKPGFADEVKLETLFTWTTDEVFRKHEPLHYGCAREALRWLHSQGLMWPFYRAWRDGVIEDPTGEKSFEAVVHMTPAEATETWRAWLQSAGAEDVVPASGEKARGQ